MWISYGPCYLLFISHKLCDCSDIFPAQHVAVSAGTGEKDLAKLNDILTEVPINFICLDVANGYSEHFVEFVKKVRAAYPHKTIIAGKLLRTNFFENLFSYSK